METLYLITGAAGHLGSVITRKLVETGKLVRALAIPNEKHLPEKAEIYFDDVGLKKIMLKYAKMTVEDS